MWLTGILFLLVTVVHYYDLQESRSTQPCDDSRVEVVAVITQHSLGTGSTKRFGGLRTTRFSVIDSVGNRVEKFGLTNAYFSSTGSLPEAELTQKVRERMQSIGMYKNYQIEYCLVGSRHMPLTISHEGEVAYSVKASTIDRWKIGMLERAENNSKIFIVFTVGCFLWSFYERYLKL